MSSGWTTGRKWLYAIKFGSWPKLLVPMLLGQAMGMSAGHGWSAGAGLVGALFTSFGLLFIVLLNDWGDQAVDRVKRQMFPDDCSPKTIPDGILGANRLLYAGLSCGACALAVALGGAWWLDRPHLAPMGVFGMVVFVAYTLPPVRLNYRGGGELLEMLGVGAILPWFNAYAQAGQLWMGELWVLPGFTLLSLASAVASGLSDEQSDRQGGKRTLTTAFGNRAARRTVELLVPAGALAWAVGAVLAGAPMLGLLPLLFVAWNYRALRACSAAAITNAFAAQGRYKQHLHRAIWHGASALALVVVVQGWLP